MFNKLNVIIREANITDAVSIAKVAVDTWRTTYIGIIPQKFLDSLSYKKATAVWQAHLSDSTGTWCYYVAENSGNKIIGYAGGAPERNGNKVYLAELCFIYILNAYKHKGIGRQLISNVALRLKQQGYNSMLVWVLEANPSRLFYEALGGLPFQKRKNNIGGVDLVEIAYGWQDLDFLTKNLTSDSLKFKIK